MTGRARMLLMVSFIGISESKNLDTEAWRVTECTEKSDCGSKWGIVGCHVTADCFTEMQNLLRPI